MGKPDSTKRPPNPAHDVSAWKQVVVTTDEFAPTSSSRAPLWIGVAIAAAVAIAIAVYLAR